MRITINVKLDFHKFQYKTLEKLVNLNFEKIAFDKYGYHERGMKKFANSKESDLRSHWDRYMSIIIKGKNKLFFSLDTSRTGLMYGGGAGDFSVKTINSVINDFSLIMTALNENEALIFASIDLEEIRDLKHKVVTKFDSGGSSYGWEGASVHEFLNFLPRVSWVTFFGAKYVQCIGANKLQDLDNVEYIEVGKETIAFKHKGNIREVSVSDLEVLEDQIGSHFFYSKERSLKGLHHPKGFKEYLVSLEDEFIRKYP